MHYGTTFKITQTTKLSQPSFSNKCRGKIPAGKQQQTSPTGVPTQGLSKQENQPRNTTINQTKQQAKQ